MQLKVAIIKDLYISLQRIEGKACFARHIAHILPNYHTERIKVQTPIIVKSRHGADFTMIGGCGKPGRIMVAVCAIFEKVNSKIR